MIKGHNLLFFVGFGVTGKPYRKPATRDRQWTCLSVTWSNMEAVATWIASQRFLCGGAF